MFFSSQLPAAVDDAKELVTPGVGFLRLRPLTIEVDGERWSLRRNGSIEVVQGELPEAAHLRLSAEDVTELVRDQRTPMTFFTGGTLDMPSGGLRDFLDWWLVLRAALDRRPLYVPGSVVFADRAGKTLDLRRTFSPADSVDEMSHFLHEAGYLHIAGVFGEDEMRRVAADMDRAAPSYSDGDGRSWWVTLADGRRRLVRMQTFNEHSPTTAAILRDDRFLRLGDIPGDGHVHTGLEGNPIEALVKPIGVVEGISDVPWHKDCSLGRHSYECCSMTVGISVNGADALSGQLRVVAGSHRALIWPALQQPGRDLPEVDLPTRTGDVTIHLSCTLHMSQPPQERERRVMYTSFRLPVAGSEARIEARKHLRAVRERAHTTVSQEPAAQVKSSRA
jgi:hypothetical protein